MRTQTVKALVSIAFVAMLLVACTTKVNNPQSTEYPCGPVGVVCGGTVGNADCCWQGDTCGGITTSCPAGYCCWVGDDSDTRLMAKKPVHDCDEQVTLAMHMCRQKHVRSGSR